MKTIIKLIPVLFYVLITFNSYSQGQRLDNRVNVLFGLGQLTQRGFNVEGNVFYRRLTFDYSHGVSLDLPNSQLQGVDKQQGLAVHLPWTTGFGVGYRFTNWLNLRAEPKWHRFELYYDGEPQKDNTLIKDYTTFTLGLGLYANLCPFKRQSNFFKGIMISPNVRWWPTVSTSLNNDTFSYNNKITNQIEVHQARRIGIGNTPFIGNISVGYSLEF